MNLKDVTTLVEDVFKKHNLTDWKFTFSTSKRAFGDCNSYFKKIRLSKVLCELNEEKHVIDSLMHEIAHALVGVKQRHNVIWKLKCREIGANPERCYSSKDVIMPPAKHIYRCPGCGKDFNYNRLLKEHNRTACAICCKGKWKKQFILERVR